MSSLRACILLACIWIPFIQGSPYRFGYKYNAPFDAIVVEAPNYDPFPSQHPVHAPGIACRHRHHFNSPTNHRDSQIPTRPSNNYNSNSYQSAFRRSSSPTDYRYPAYTSFMVHQEHPKSRVIIGYREA